jgi:hypothetical protein
MKYSVVYMCSGRLVTAIFSVRNWESICSPLNSERSVSNSSLPCKSDKQFGPKTTLLTCILEILGWNFGQDTACVDCGFPMAFLSPPKNLSGNCFDLARTASFRTLPYIYKCVCVWLYFHATVILHETQYSSDKEGLSKNQTYIYIYIYIYILNLHSLKLAFPIALKVHLIGGYPKEELYRNLWLLSN